MTRLFALFLLFSGIASLTYQVVWVRLLGISMGSTSASISTVLAAFFLGLAIGSYFADRLTRSKKSDFRRYLILEAAIAISGLLLLPILINLESVVAAIPGLSSTIPMKFLLTMVLLSIPTICMGATFPVMAALLIRKQSNYGVRMSQLYSLNTAGAVLGAGLSGFVFVPLWGLDGAVYIAVSINVFIVVTGLFFNSRIVLAPVDEDAKVDIQPTLQNKIIPHEERLRKQALLVLVITGFVSIACEVAWTKYLSIFTGTTIYGFSAILTIFLVGISAGSWVIRNYVLKMNKPAMWMGVLVLLLGISIIFTRVALSWLPNLYDLINQLTSNVWLIRIYKYSLIFIILFIPTFILGALFPINLKVYCGNLKGIRKRIGKAYAVNTIASIFGAVAAGFYFIPEYGTDKLLTSMAFLLLATSLIFFVSIQTKVRKLTLIALVVAIVVANTWLPHLDYKSLITSVNYNAKYTASKKSYKNPSYLFLKEGKMGVVSMVTYDGHTVYLQNNGLKESIFDIKNKYRTPVIESLLGLVPYFLHDDPKSAFVIGFGGGVTTSALGYTKLNTIKVVELEPAVVDGGRAVYGGEIPVLQNPRVSIEFNDARNTLLMSNKKYDIIASQPSHPWLAHAATVFTKEFFMLVRSRLADRGIYGQWINLFHMDVTTLKSLFKSFYSVFPEGMVFANINTGDLIMFGSNHKLYFNNKKIERRLAEPEVKKLMNFNKIYNANDLLYYFALSRKQAVSVSHSARVNTDLNILSEVRLSALGNRVPRAENPYIFLKQLYRLEINSYFESNREENLVNVGSYLLARNDFKLAGFIADQLKVIAPAKSRSLRFEILWRQGQNEQARTFYNQHKKWSDRIHMLQAFMLLDSSDIAKAREILGKITSSVVQLELASQLLFSETKYKKYKKLEEKNIEQLLGYNKNSLIKVGQELYAVKTSKLSSLPKLVVLEKYYRNAHARTVKSVNELTELKHREKSKLKSNMTKALADSNLDLAMRLLKHMEQYNVFDNNRLQEYRSEIIRLSVKGATKKSVQ